MVGKMSAKSEISRMVRAGGQPVSPSRSLCLSRAAIFSSLARAEVTAKNGTMFATAAMFTAITSR